MVPAFEKNTFEGKFGYIDGIIKEFTREHLFHYHVHLYPEAMGLYTWGQHAVRSTGRPTLVLPRTDEPRFLSDRELPDEQLKLPYAIDGEAVLVRLDLLPPRYYLSVAKHGGLPVSKGFEMHYRTVKGQFNQDTAGFEFPDNTKSAYYISRLRADPSIITGTAITFPNEMQVWKGIIYHAMRELGIWHDSFKGLTYTDTDNCIEHFPRGFDYDLLIPLMEEFGGWIDYKPGIREGCSAVLTCNFTTAGHDDKGMKAIVQSAYAPHAMGGLSVGQKRFIEAAFAAFGVQ